MNVEICEAQSPDCDAFVQRMRGAKICHLFAWARHVVRPLGHKPFYLVAYRDGRICGVLPLTLIRSRLFGDRIISQAFSNYGGPLVEDETALKALYDRAVELCEEYRCESMEFRNIEPLPYGLHLRTDKVTFCILTASLPCSGCPTRTDWFLQENVPKKACLPEQIIKIQEEKRKVEGQVLEPAARTEFVN